MHTGYLGAYLRTTWQRLALQYVLQRLPLTTLSQHHEQSLVSTACGHKFLAVHETAVVALSPVTPRWQLLPADVARFNYELIPRTLPGSLRLAVYRTQRWQVEHHQSLLCVCPARRFCSSKKFPMSRRTLVNLFSLKRIAADGDRRNHQD